MKNDWMVDRLALIAVLPGPDIARSRGRRDHVP